MGDNGRRGKQHNDQFSDPHPDLHTGSGAASGPAMIHTNMATEAAGVTPDGKEPSMGGSQGTQAEARHETRDNKHHTSTSDSAKSATSRDGGYGADSGYSDAPDKSRRHTREGEPGK